MILLHATSLILLNVTHFVSHLIPLAPHLPACDPVGGALNKAAQSIQADARTVGAIVFVLAVIIAGIMRMIAFGSERRVAISNMALTAAVVGLGIVLLAPLIQNALISWVGNGSNGC
jgi:type IV secretory pathway VirB2 component (pilin)